MAKMLPPTIVEDWGFGVVTSLEADAIPKNASPRGWNSNLISIGGEKAVVEKRKGFKTANSTAISGATAILGMTEFERRTAGAATFTRTHIVYSQNGRLDILKSDGTTEAYDSGTPTPFASGDTPPDFCIANNECFIVNGERNRKATFKSPNREVFKVGLTRPSAPTTGTTGTGMTGTYHVRLTFYNSYTGLQSSASDFTSQVVTNQQVRVTLPTSVATDEEATHVRIGVRKVGLQSQFFQVGEVTLGTTPFDINQTDAQLIALTTLFPDTAENDPPPVYSVMNWHKERAFGAGPVNPSLLYFSQLGQPEAVDPENFEPIADDDGEGITAVISAFEIEIIFKNSNIYGLIGEDPQTWRVERLAPGVGTASHRSVVLVEDTLYWWDPVQGPMSWKGPGSVPEPIGQALISATVSTEAVNYAKANRVVASVDTTPQAEFVLFSTAEKNPEGESSFTNNGISFPFNYRLKRWVSDKWNPLDMASLAAVTDDNGKKWLYVGGYYGQIFRYADAQADGIETGTKRGTVTSATTTTLTDGSAAFMTSGAGLRGRYVYVTAPGGLSVQRRRIGSNTATVLTLDTGLTWSTVPTDQYTYVIGGPDWQWDTYNISENSTFFRKRYRFALQQMKTPESVITVNLDLLYDYSLAVGQQLSFLVTPGGGQWDQAIWDISQFGAQSAKAGRLRVGNSANAVRMRFRNGNPDERLVLLKAGMLAELKSERMS